MGYTLSADYLPEPDGYQEEIERKYAAGEIAYSEMFRAWWADPLGALVEAKPCGCREYTLGRGVCKKHLDEFWEGLAKA